MASCGTELCFPAEYAGKVFSFGDCGLQCLYTNTPDQMESFICAKRLCCPGLSDGEIAELLERHRRACNGDSSIWALRRGGTAACPV